MFESDADRLALIKGLGGLLVRHDGGEFWAIFDRDYATAESVETRVTALTARTSDVQSMSKDTTVYVGDEMFRIKRHEPDALGMTALILKR